MDSTAKHSTAQAWRERIVAQQASGLPIRVWCRDNGCHEHSFYWWRARLNLQPGAVKKRRRVTPKPMPFAEVLLDRRVTQPAQATETSAALSLRLAGGRELVLPASMPLEQVARLVILIEGAK